MKEYSTAFTAPHAFTHRGSTSAFNSQIYNCSRNKYITAPETANIPKLIKIRQNDGFYLVLDKKKNIFFFLKFFFAFFDTENVGLSIKIRSLRQLQAEKLANVIFANFSAAILKNRQNGRSIPGYQVLTS